MICKDLPPSLSIVGDRHLRPGRHALPLGVSRGLHARRAHGTSRGGEGAGALEVL